MNHGTTNCQHCHRPTQLFLCDDCTTQLANMLDELPWLLDQLDARIQKLDRISVGTVGRSRRPDQLNVIDFDAAEQARAVRKVLLQWVKTIAEHHTGRQPTMLDATSTKDLARWLRHNIDAIARIDLAHKGRHPLYDAINTLVGTNPQGGTLVAAINPVEKHAAGPCPTIVGKTSEGRPRQCARMLFADVYAQTVDCPTCGQTIDVKENRGRAAADRDLHTKSDLAEILANIDEPIDDGQLDGWITARALRPRGYQHDGTIVEYRINSSDEPVYSVDRARKLRRRDNNLRTRTRRRAEWNHQSA